MTINHPSDGGPSEEHRQRRARALIDVLRLRFGVSGKFCTWELLKEKLDYLDGDLYETPIPTLRSWQQQARTCPVDKLAALERVERVTRAKGQRVKMFEMQASEFADPEDIAADMAWQIRRFEHWDVIAPLAKGEHRYRMSPETHRKWAKYKAVAQAILEVEPSEERSMALAVVVGMRLGTSLWHTGKAEDQQLVRHVFGRTERFLKRLQMRWKVVDLRDANPQLASVGTEQELIVSQHYCLQQDNDILEDFYQRLRRGAFNPAQEQGVNAHCVACAFFARASDPARPPHEQAVAIEQARRVAESKDVQRLCEQEVDPETAFYANAVVGAAWAAPAPDYRRASQYLHRAKDLSGHASTPAFVAFALYYWACANRASPDVRTALEHALVKVFEEPVNLCVMPVHKLRQDILLLYEEIRDGGQPFRLIPP